jgi:FtsH-binding integral membrane protein
MSNLSRRPGSSPSRSQRERRAFQLLVVGGGAAVVAVVALALAIAGVLGSGLFFIALIVALACVFLFRRTVGPGR